MVPITARFQAESALHPAARALLLEIFDQGWAEPRKLHLESRRAAILLQEAKESIAADLDLSPTEVHFLGEITLGFQLGIMGLIQPETRMVHSSIDRAEVLAIASQFPSSVEMEVSNSGVVALPELRPSDLLIWQYVNAETGLIRTMPIELVEFSGRVFVDHTAYPTQAPAIASWSSALWDSSSWSGPNGLSIFALRTGAKGWRNPFPHLHQSVVPSGFSLPLALASAVALRHWRSDEEVNKTKITKLATRIRAFISENIPDTDMIEEQWNSWSAIVSLSFLYIDAERLQSDLADEGFTVDSGSACTSANLEASHVLKAMGLLSQGNIRLRLHHDVTATEIDVFLPVLKRLVEKQRQ